MFDRSVLIVSGKGGVGKTTVASACALAAGRKRRRVVLAEIEGRGGLSRLLGIPPPGFEERRTPFGHAALSITAKDALLEYLWLFFRMKALSRSLQRAKVVDVAAEAIPGFRDVMVAGKLYELTTYRSGPGASHGRSPYDLVVVDAPPTGQFLSFLESAGGYGDLIKSGRVNRQLVSIDRLLRKDTRIVLVAIAEEMSVAETVETVDALREAGFPEPTIVVNQLVPSPFPRGTRAAGMRLEQPDVVRLLREAGAEADEDDAGELLQTIRDVDARHREEQRHVARLEKVAPVIELPFLFTPSFGPAEVRALSEGLAA
ncbi:MAG: ATPase [Actinobacteria bacterium]|nr:ATPase [Actinomycetota bacterium]